jgi:hypothetical protein
MKYIGVLLASLVLCFSSCSTVDVVNSPYHINFVDETNIIKINGVKFYAPTRLGFYLDYGTRGIVIDITNASDKPVTLLLSETFIAHDGVEDGIALAQVDGRENYDFFSSPRNQTLQPGETFQNVFYPRSIAKLTGYQSGTNKPQYSHGIMSDPISLTLFYRSEDTKHSITVNFDKL